MKKYTEPSILVVQLSPFSLFAYSIDGSPIGGSTTGPFLAPRAPIDDEGEEEEEEEDCGPSKIWSNSL